MLGPAKPGKVLWQSGHCAQCGDVLVRVVGDERGTLVARECATCGRDCRYD